MARPREDHVPTERGQCPSHGSIVMRLHKSRKRKDGTQAYLKRCPDCHAEKNLAAYHRT